MDAYKIETIPLGVSHIPPVQPKSLTLKMGSINGPGAKKLNCDIVFTQDVPVRMRDGVTIYVDVFKPVTTEKVPAILAWGPYGKSLHKLDFPWFVTADRLSGLQAFEGPDPGFWCEKGYAVVNADARGACNSEGILQQWGTTEGSDVSDCIEWISSQDWCNGNVGMSGTSWLAIIQWHTAALRPPALKAIAPWEGCSDGYRQTIAKGGIVNTVMDIGVFKTLIQGKNGAESTPTMAAKYPLFNAYWETKEAKVENIEIPVYVVASYTNINHSVGTFETWCDLGSEKKWLRIHNTHEWHDYYSHETDLLRFFDRYLKNLDNDWETTPKVRMSVLDPGRWDVVDRPEEDFPIPRTRYETLFLDAETMSLSAEKPQLHSICAYDSEDKDNAAVFSFCVPERIELSGYMKLRIWVAAEITDDFELFVYQRKADGHKSPMLPVVYGAEMSGFDGLKFLGTSGWLKASLRKSAGLRTDGMRVVREFRERDNPVPGDPVLMEITLSPMAMNFYPGEHLQLVVSGYPLNPTDSVCALDPEGARFESCNRGKHVIHTGGQYDSDLTIPIIPA